MLFDKRATHNQFNNVQRGIIGRGRLNILEERFEVAGSGGVGDDAFFQDGAGFGGIFGYITVKVKRLR